jgi:hypothetical protein
MNKSFGNTQSDERSGNFSSNMGMPVFNPQSVNGYAGYYSSRIMIKTGLPLHL